MSFLNTYNSSPSIRLGEKKEDKTKGKFLKEAFFFLEHSSDKELEKGDETDSFRDKLLYFYPETLPKDEQLFFVGIIQGYISFASNFEPHDGEKVTLIKFTYSKIALTFVGDLFVVFCGPSSQPDEGLKRSLSRIVEAITFYNGPIESIKSRFEERQEYVDYMRFVGSEASLLARIFNNPNPTPSSFLEPIPYLELPLNSNSLFIGSNQVLDSFFEYEGYQGGVILYDDFVLSSQLDDDLVSWILYRNQLLKETRKKLKKKSTLSEQSPLSSSLPTFPKSYLKEYSDDEQDMATMSIEEVVSDDEQDVNVDDFLFDFNSSGRNFNKKLDIFPVYLNAKQSKQYPTPGMKSYEIGGEMIEKPSEGDFYALVIHHAEVISCAYLMDLPQMKNPQLLKDMKSDIQEKITALAARVKMSLLSKQQSKYVVKSKVGFLRSGGVSSSVLIYDGINRQATGYYNHKSRFLHQISVAHEHLQKNQDVKKIILRNNAGYLYSEKLYETEVFYHHAFIHRKATFVEMTPLDQLERTCRENILRDFELNLL